MMKRIAIALGGIGASLALSGCGSDSTKSTDAGTPPPTTTAPTPVTAAAFGTAFASYFNADANSDPKTPTAADVPAISTTTNPVGS